MLSIIGFVVVVTVMTLLILGRASPIVGLTLVPVAGALAAGFSVAEIGEFFESGLGSVMDVVVMFIFAILFFGVMNDVGLFRPLINLTIRWTGGSVVAVAVGTVLVVTVCSLDGSGATTFLISIPALLPLYRQLEMSPYLLMLLAGTTGGVVNMLPWAGPIGRAAAVLEMDPTELWLPLIPVQAIALVLMIGMAVLLGKREERRIATRQKTMAGATTGAGVAGDDTSGPATAGSAGTDSSETGSSDNGDATMGRAPLWLNAVLALTVVGVLIWGILPSGYVFMMGLGLALLANFPRIADQGDRIRAHAPSALLMGGIIIAAGSFLGILDESGMLDSLAEDLVAILPGMLVPHLHLIVGVIGMPLELLLSTDAYYFGLLPVVESIVSEHGVPSTTVVYALTIGNIIGTFISPFSPALWLALGLAGIEIGKHIRYSFWWMWGFSLVVLLVAVLLGVIQI